MCFFVRKCVWFFFRREKPFELLVAPDADFRAEGLLYWDDGDSLSTTRLTFSYI